MKQLKAQCNYCHNHQELHMVIIKANVSKVINNVRIDFENNSYNYYHNLLELHSVIIAVKMSFLKMV